jgi:hypothetical protein
MISAFEIAAVFEITLSLLAVRYRGLYEGWYLFIINHQ